MFFGSENSRLFSIQGTVFFHQYENLIIKINTKKALLHNFWLTCIHGTMADTKHIVVVKTCHNKQRELTLRISTVMRA